MQRKHKYFQVHLVGDTYYVRDNSSDRSTVMNDAPIFLCRRAAWQWARNKNSNNAVYIEDGSILI